MAPKCTSGINVRLNLTFKKLKSRKSKKKSAANCNIHVFKNSFFFKKLRLQKWCCNQPKILFLVSKIWACLLFPNPSLNVSFWHLNDQIFWFLNPSNPYLSHLTSFLNSDNLKRKLTVCTVKNCNLHLITAAIWHKDYNCFEQKNICQPIHC